MFPFLPSRLSQELKREFKIAVSRLWYARRTRAQLSKMRACRVNVGCGRRPVNGWINLDLFRSHEVYFWDCRYGLPFQDNSVAAIYSEHAFEHFEIESEAKPFLRECFAMVMEAGFANAFQKQFGDSCDPLMVPDRLDRSTESLYVEALK
jgi:hypothetical protein